MLRKSKNKRVLVCFIDIYFVKKKKIKLVKLSPSIYLQKSDSPSYHYLFLTFIDFLSLSIMIQVDSPSVQTCLVTLLTPALCSSPKQVSDCLVLVPFVEIKLVCNNRENRDEENILYISLICKPYKYFLFKHEVYGHAHK